MHPSSPPGAPFPVSPVPVARGGTTCYSEHVIRPITPLPLDRSLEVRDREVNLGLRKLYRVLGSPWNFSGLGPTVFSTGHPPSPLGVHGKTGSPFFESHAAHNANSENGREAVTFLLIWHFS